MRGGHNRKPPKLRVLQGNPGRRPVVELPQSRKAPLTPPEPLAPAARALWDAMAPDLIASDHLTMLNRHVFASACTWWAISREAIGWKRQSAAYVLAFRVLRDFGCTPASLVALGKRPLKDSPGTKWAGTLS